MDFSLNPSRIGSETETEDFLLTKWMIFESELRVPEFPPLYEEWPEANDPENPHQEGDVGEEHVTENENEVFTPGQSPEKRTRQYTTPLPPLPTLGPVIPRAAFSGSP